MALEGVSTEVQDKLGLLGTDTHNESENEVEDGEITDDDEEVPAVTVSQTPPPSAAKNVSPHKSPEKRTSGGSGGGGAGNSTELTMLALAGYDQQTVEEVVQRRNEPPKHHHGPSGILGGEQDTFSPTTSSSSSSKRSRSRRTSSREGGGGGPPRKRNRRGDDENVYRRNDSGGRGGGGDEGGRGEHHHHREGGEGVGGGEGKASLRHVFDDDEDDDVEAGVGAPMIEGEGENRDDAADMLPGGGGGGREGKKGRHRRGRRSSPANGGGGDEIKREGHRRDRSNDKSHRKSRRRGGGDKGGGGGKRASGREERRPGRRERSPQNNRDICRFYLQQKCRKPSFRCCYHPDDACLRSGFEAATNDDECVYCMASTDEDDLFSEVSSLSSWNDEGTTVATTSDEDLYSNISSRSLSSGAAISISSEGSDCPYSHDAPLERRNELCRFYISQQCMRNDCPYMHGEFPCKFFHTGVKCFADNKCRFSHAPLDDDMRQVLNRYLNGRIEDENGVRPSLLGSPPRHLLQQQQQPQQQPQEQGDIDPWLHDQQRGGPGAMPQPWSDNQRPGFYEDRLLGSDFNDDRRGLGPVLGRGGPDAGLRPGREAERPIIRDQEHPDRMFHEPVDIRRGLDFRDPEYRGGVPGGRGGVPTNLDFRDDRQNDFRGNSNFRRDDFQDRRDFDNNRAGNFDGPRGGVNFDGPRDINFDGPRGGNFEGARGGNFDGPRGGNFVGPRGGNFDDPRVGNFDGHRGANFEGPRNNFDNARNFDGPRGPYDGARGRFDGPQDNFNGPRDFDGRAINFDGRGANFDGPPRGGYDGPRGPYDGRLVGYDGPCDGPRGGPYGGPNYIQGPPMGNYPGGPRDRPWDDVPPHMRGEMVRGGSRSPPQQQHPDSGGRQRTNSEGSGGGDLDGGHPSHLAKPQRDLFLRIQQRQGGGGNVSGAEPGVPGASPRATGSDGDDGDRTPVQDGEVDDESPSDGDGSGKRRNDGTASSSKNTKGHGSGEEKKDSAAAGAARKRDKSANKNVLDDDDDDCDDDQPIAAVLKKLQQEPLRSDDNAGQANMGPRGPNVGPARGDMNMGKMLSDIRQQAGVGVHGAFVPGLPFPALAPNNGNNDLLKQILASVHGVQPQIGGLPPQQQEQPLSRDPRRARHLGASALPPLGVPGAGILGPAPPGAPYPPFNQFGPLGAPRPGFPALVTQPFPINPLAAAGLPLPNTSMPPPSVVPPPVSGALGSVAGPPQQALPVFPKLEVRDPRRRDRELNTPNPSVIHETAFIDSKDGDAPYVVRIITRAQPHYDQFTHLAQFDPKLRNDPRIAKYLNAKSSTGGAGSQSSGAASTTAATPQSPIPDTPASPPRQPESSRTGGSQIPVQATPPIQLSGQAPPMPAALRSSTDTSKVMPSLPPIILPPLAPSPPHQGNNTTAAKVDPRTARASAAARNNSVPTTTPSAADPRSKDPRSRAAAATAAPAARSMNYASPLNLYGDDKPTGGTNSYQRKIKMASPAISTSNVTTPPPTSNIGSQSVHNTAALTAPPTGNSNEVAYDEGVHVVLLEDPTTSLRDVFKTKDPTASPFC